MWMFTCVVAVGVRIGPTPGFDSISDDELLFNRRRIDEMQLSQFPTERVAEQEWMRNTRIIVDAVIKHTSNIFTLNKRRRTVDRLAETTIFSEIEASHGNNRTE